MSNFNEKELVRVLYGYKNSIFAYLFGSRANNTIGFESDLDIALYFDREPELIEIGQLVAELENISGCTVDLVALNNLYEKNPRLAYSIINEGRLLYCVDEIALIAFKKNTLLNYFDFKPVIILFERKIGERINSKKFAQLNL
jgi:uncharacterized protein